ncbi:CAF1-domain-containing protein [Daldinia decipiens]|uniref:CAF1-domain-containing protein n=1 Tax=Daldinia decipiens TaxID=326647 RepID=UPI0020C5209E|nr:CAF1-domain-containing protein [Daldinia decipiens]KAI1660326.1 CAF1-domain-containing protein [Daldinia decipiens]
MEVNRSNFFWMLPPILHEAQNARFVAVDVEMSGIALIHGLNSAQDSYGKIKEAAEQFQVVQLGLTFVRYDEGSAKYTTRTFTFSVSPLFPKSTFFDNLSRRLDRKFSVSVRAYDFLQQHNFNFNKALDTGAHYLNREEQRLAKQFCVSRDPNNEHLDPSTLDYETEEFYKRTKKQIADFVAGRFRPAMETTIKNPYGDRLNGLQIRLIHQIIREEYPSYVATRNATSGTASIALIDESVKARTEARKRWNLSEVNRLSGLQILFEALSGGSFADRMKQEYVYHQSDVPERHRTWNELNKTFDFKKCEASLKRNRPILVGHNLFMDLAYIYQTFFEPLPANVDDFLIEINKLFPRIADTRFMYARGRHMMEPDRALEKIHHFYARNPIPAVRLESGINLLGPHHAGSDSCMAASLFLKQTYTLFRAKKHLVPFEKGFYAPKEQNNQGEKDEREPTTPDMTSWPETSAINILEQDDDQMLRNLERWNILDEAASRRVVLSPRHSKAMPPAEEILTRGEPTSASGETYSEEETHMLPLWTHDFWRAYGNKCSVPGAGYISFEPVS